MIRVILANWTFLARVGDMCVCSELIGNSSPFDCPKPYYLRSIRMISMQIGMEIQIESTRRRFDKL